MASFDSLPPDQKAVLSMVLQRDLSFDQIAAMLALDRAGVRRRALESFDALGPDTTLEPLKRALITDYLLGQLPVRVAETVRGSLSANPAERAWARIVAAEIAPVAIKALPEIPAAGAKPASTPGPPPPAPASAAAAAPLAAASVTSPGTTATSAGATDEPPSAEGLDGPRAPASSRRGGAILLGLIAIAVIAVVVVLLATGGSKKPATATELKPAAGSGTTSTTGASGTGTAGATVPLHQITMTSPQGTNGREGVADVVRADGKTGLVVVAEGLVPNVKSAYGVWLYDSASGASKFLGFYGTKVAATGKTKGDLEAEVALPSGASAYNELLLTLETVEKPTKPGTIVLEGAFAE